MCTPRIVDIFPFLMEELKDVPDISMCTFLCVPLCNSVHCDKEHGEAAVK